ncbi:MAG: hypothetical protein IJ835_00995 [Muribaculaceae bacterium]|nr:hypothetical protein [Muribaculaceae bacterium]
MADGFLERRAQDLDAMQARRDAKRRRQWRRALDAYRRSLADGKNQPRQDS